MATVPEYYKQALADMEGYIPDGKTPKLRLVFAPETLHAHGKLEGVPKYHDPETGKAYECWILEAWYPPEMCGTREAWFFDLMGPYPADCHLDCCNGGYWGLRTPIMTTSGKFIPLSEETLEAIRRKQFMDIGWSILSDAQRYAQLNTYRSEREKQSDADVEKVVISDLEHYATHKEEMDNADNRVFSFGKDTAVIVPGGKMPIGRPN